MTEPPEAILLDLTQFTSPEQAMQIIARDRGFDDAVKDGLAEISERGYGMTVMLAFTLSSISRARGFHEAIVREIRQSNPQIVFTLMRQFLETMIVVRYTADNPNYVQALANEKMSKSKAREAGIPMRRTMRELVEYMDRTYSTQMAHVYGQLCEITHFGSLAIWSAHRLEPVSGDVTNHERVSTWASAPRWKSQEEMYIACAQLLELAEEMEAALKSLVRSCLSVMENSQAAARFVDPDLG